MLSKTSKTCFDFYDRKYNSVRNGLCLNKIEDKKEEIKVDVCENIYICEALACSKFADSKICISLKSGNQMFFRLCSFCKDTIEKELVDGGIKK